MSCREETHRSLLPQSFNYPVAVPTKALDGQYPPGRKSTRPDKEYQTDEARRRQKRHEEAQRRSENKKLLEDNKRDFRSFAETHDARRNISPEERHRRNHPYRDGYPNEKDQSSPYPILKSTSPYLHDEGIFFDSPAFANDLAERPSNPYDTTPRRKPPPNSQSSTSREAKVEASSPQLGLTRTDTDMSADSDDSFSDIELDDPLGYAHSDAYDYEEVKHVRVPGRVTNGGAHRLR